MKHIGAVIEEQKGEVKIHPEQGQGDSGDNGEHPEACPVCNGARFVLNGHGDLVPCSCYVETLARMRQERLLSGMGMPERLQEMTFANFHPEWARDPVPPPGLLKSRRPQDQALCREITRRQRILAERYHGRAAEQLRKVYDRCREYAAKPQGWLTLLGDVGCGKTHLAAAIANYRREHGGQCIFTVVPDLLDHLRATYHPQSAVRYDSRFEALCNIPLLILDDLGAESSTAWAAEKLYQLCNYRYNAKLPTVITANAVHLLEPRISSRATERGFGEVWEILAGDLRQHLQR